MRPQALFAALAEIADEHDRHLGAELLVIPVLSDELETRRALLTEVAEFLGGVLLDLTTGEYDQAIAAHDHPVLRGAVQTGLTFDRPGGGRTELQLSYGGGRLDASLRVRDRLVTVPSPVESQLMAIGRALFDERLVEHELAILLYDENPFDDVVQHAVLGMLTGLGRQAGLRLGAARTLVPFVRAAGLDRNRHCKLHRGVRYSLEGASLTRRHRTRHLVDVVRKLTAPRPQPLVLFLGAGFSASSSMPIGNSMRNATIRRICQLPDHEDFSDVDLASGLFRFAGAPGRDLLSNQERYIGEAEFARSATLEQAARIERDLLEVSVPQTILDLQTRHNRILADQHARLGDAVYAMHKLIDDRRRMVLVTINFDELIEHDHEDALDIAIDDDDFGRLAPILARMRRGEDHPDAKIPLLKLHGTINQPDTCIVTDAQTRSGITPAKTEALMSLVRDVPPAESVQWVYVGASMRDIDLDRVFGHREFNDSVSERWVMPWPEESVRRFVDGKTRGWEARESLLERTVTETADSFMRVLADDWP